MTADRQCLGCGEIGPWDRSGRCPDCFADRPTYDEVHRGERARFARLLNDGACLDCPRCGRPIDASMPWDLGHQADGSWHPEIPGATAATAASPSAPAATRALLSTIAQEVRR